LPKLVLGDREFEIDVSAFQELIRKLNFPLEVAWSPVLYAADRFGGRSGAGGESLFVAEVMIAAILFLASVAAFWYFVTVEIEMRTQGHSMLMFSTLPKQLSVSGVMLLFGLLAVWEMFSGKFASLGLLNMDSYRIARGLILFAWGVILIGCACWDLKTFFARRTLSSRTAQPC
jgi:hypothetical protein